MPDWQSDNYEVVADGPTPTSWDEYAQTVSAEWDRVLADPNVGEPEMHDFLEKHPCMVPGHDAFNAAGLGRLPAGPIRACLFSKPPLPGISRRIPDFVWLPTDSQTQWVVLIEIEDSRKSWLTKKGEQTAALTQAVNQVLSWKEHLANPANLLQFARMYKLSMSRPVELIFCLVYGRRREIQAEAAARKINSLRRQGLISMTYDRLVPAEATRNCLCVRVCGEEFKAVYAPATLRINLNLIGMWQEVTQKADAVLASPHFPKERRTFLAERFRYWDGTLSLADWDAGE